MKYPRTLGWSVVITMWVIMGVSLKHMKNPVIQDTSDIAEDMIGWIIEDVANGRLDSTTADTYIYNLEEIIIDLKVTR